MPMDGPMDGRCPSKMIRKVNKNDTYRKGPDPTPSHMQMPPGIRPPYSKPCYLQSSHSALVCLPGCVVSSLCFCSPTLTSVWCSASVLSLLSMPRST